MYNNQALKVNERKMSKIPEMKNSQFLKVSSRLRSKIAIKIYVKMF